MLAHVTGFKSWNINFKSNQGNTVAAFVQLSYGNLRRINVKIQPGYSVGEIMATIYWVLEIL